MTIVSTSGPKWASGPHDDLLLPNGTKVGHVNDPTLRTTLHRLGVPGAHNAPRSEIVSRYAAMVRKVYDDAGKAAVDKWLQDNRG